MSVWTLSSRVLSNPGAITQYRRRINLTAKLYPGIAFSPVAELTDNVGAGDAIIPVSDVEAFPPAPNLATIGTDEEGETVLYAAKTATALSGCTRGVEGTARAWSAGEPIARNWTAKDHGDLITAVGEADTAAQTANKVAQEAKDGAEPKGTADAVVSAHNSDSTAHEELFAAKQPKLTGQPGQVVGFDGMGLAYAVPGWSNPNLLDNWYFAAPVNQRGQTEYTEPGYSIDRWTLQNITNAGLIVHDGYITLSATSNDGLLQRFEPSRLILGAEYTMSVLTHDGQLLTSPFVLSNQGVIENYAGTEWSGFHGYDPGTSTFLFYPIIAYGKAAQISIDLVAAKLELGSVQTLARKEGDAWVLNDPPPNKALELEKCQRYLCPLNIYGWLRIRSSSSDINWLTFSVPIPVTMRAKPVLTGDISKLMIQDVSGEVKSGYTLSIDGYGPGWVMVIARTSNNDINDACLVCGSGDGIQFFDANL